MVYYTKGNTASFTLVSKGENWKEAILFIFYNSNKNYKPIAGTNEQSTCDM